MLALRHGNRLMIETLAAARAAEQSGRWDEALEIYESALRSRDVLKDVSVAEILRKTGLVQYHRGYFDSAAELFESSRDIAENEGLLDQVALAANCQAVAVEALGRLDEAELLYGEAYELARRVQNKRLLVMITQNLGTVASIRGDSRAALAHYKKALHGFVELVDTRGVARTFNNMGMAHAELTEVDAADNCYARAFEVASITEDSELLGTIALNRAELMIKALRFVEARDACDDAFEIFGRLGSRSGLAETYKCYAMIYRYSGKLQLAAAHLEIVADVAREAHHPLLEGEAAQELGLVHLADGRNADALRQFNQAYGIFDSLHAVHRLTTIDRLLNELELYYTEAASTWSESIEAKDPYTAGHCRRVANLSTAVAEQFGFGRRDLHWLRIGALLHDVGKINVRAEVLNKPGALTADEWEEMKTHTTSGAAIIDAIQFPDHVRAMVRNHHERWNGTGYPDQLAGESIPLSARILTVADIYDALTSARSYRPPRRRFEALKIMKDEVGRGIDGKVFEAFLSVLDSLRQTED